MRRELKRRQNRLKAANDVHRDGLCGVEDVLNGREVEIGGFVRRDAAKKQRVREIGALQMRRAVLRSELQPENRRENERQGREVDAASSAVKKRENRADETHIVVLGKPTRDDGGAVRVESAKNDVDVGDERGDGDHDAFGKRCAARSVLEEAEMVAGEVESRLVCVIRRRIRGKPDGTSGREDVSRMELRLIHSKSGHWTPDAVKRAFMSVTRLIFMYSLQWREKQKETCHIARLWLDSFAGFQKTAERSF